MKVLVLGNKERYLRYMPELPITKQVEICYHSILDPQEEILQDGADAQVIAADAIAKVDRALIDQMPNLQLIHSEGVAYNAFDCHAAAERGIYVCNNKGVNATAVAEQTILLMLAALRQLVPGDAAVRSGQQIQKKEAIMVQGLTELGDCTVGLLGFGDIGQATAKRLTGFGCRVLYHCRHPKEGAIEQACGAHWVSKEELLAQSDILSLHVPVTPETRGSVDADFLKQMKTGALLINTARGEIVDSLAVRQALIAGKLSGAGFDTLAPEPNRIDDPLIDLPAEIRERVVYSPHIAGSTIRTFRRTHLHVWQNIQRLADGERPDCIVNGI